MKFAAACVAGLIVAGFGSLAAAGPVADAAARAEALQAERKTVEALDALNAAIDALWTEVPLSFRKSVLVQSSEGYGDYVERTDRTFRPDEPIMVYVEPVGFGYGQSGDASTIAFDADVAIQNTTGQVLAEAKDAFEFSTETYPNRREFGMTLSFAAPYYRPGDYTAVFTLRDRNSDKSGSFEIPFTLTTPAADASAAEGAAGSAEAGEDQAAPQ